MCDLTLRDGPTIWRRRKNNRAKRSRAGLPGSVLCSGNTLLHGQWYRSVVEHCACLYRGRELKWSGANISRNRQIETERGVGADPRHLNREPTLLPTRWRRRWNGYSRQLADTSLTNWPFERERE